MGVRSHARLTAVARPDATMQWGQEGVLDATGKWASVHTLLRRAGTDATSKMVAERGRVPKETARSPRLIRLRRISARDDVLGVVGAGADATLTIVC